MSTDRRTFLTGLLALGVTLRPRDFGPIDDDATAGIMAAHAECVRNGGGTIVIDRPMRCTSAQRNGHAWTTLELFADNLTLEFVGDGELIFPRRGLVNYRPVLVGGVGKVNAPLEGSRCIDVPVMPLARPVERDSRELVFHGTPDLRPGDIGFIRTGQLLPGRTDEPDAELVEIAAVDGQRVLLTAPLSKSYVFDPCSPNAPFGVARVTDRVSRNIRLINPRISTVESLQAISLWSVLEFATSGGLLTYDFLGVGARDTRDVRWATPLQHTGRVSEGSYSIAPSTGCTRWAIDLDATSKGFSYAHIHEGVADLKLSGSIVNAGDDGEKNPALSIAAGSRHVSVPFLSIDTGRSEQPAILVDSSVGRVDFGNVEVHNMSRTGSAIRLDTPDARFAREPRLVGRNQIVKRLSGERACAL